MTQDSDLKLVTAIAIVALLVAGTTLVLQIQADNAGSKVPLGDWKNTTKPTVTDWNDMVNNVSGSYNWTNTSVSNVLTGTGTNITAAELVAINVSVTANSRNISALAGNGSVVMNTGTDAPWQNLTTSYARITAGVQSLNFTMPAAGSYLVDVDLRENLSVTALNTTNTYSEYVLCDANGTTTVANSERLGTRLSVSASNITLMNKHFTWLYTNASRSNVGICAKISDNVTGQWSVGSDSVGRSVITWVKLP